MARIRVLTEKEISEFLARREDIRRLIEGPLAAFEIKGAKSSVAGEDDYNLKVCYKDEVAIGIDTSLYIIDFSHSSWEEGKNDVVQLELKPKDKEADAMDAFDRIRFLFADRLSTIHIDCISEHEWPKTRKKEKTIRKKMTDENMLEVTVTEKSTLTEYEFVQRKDWYGYPAILDRRTVKNQVDSAEDTYRFYRYSGVCTEENEYEGKVVTVLFPDDGTSQKKRMKNSPVIFRTMPLEETNLYEYYHRDYWPYSKDLFFDSVTEYKLYSPLFFTDAPFIEVENNRKEPKTGEIAKIRSGIFAAMEAFAKDNPDIAYRYIPTGYFLTLYADLVREQISERESRMLNGGIFFKKCRILPTDKGLISIEELYDKTKIDPNPPEYRLQYNDREAFGAAVEKFAGTLGRKDIDPDTFKKKTGKLLLWDKYGEEMKSLCVHNVGIIAGSVGCCMKISEMEQELLDEYINRGRYKSIINSYTSVSPALFRHVRGVLFENPDAPEADEFVRTALKENRVAANDLFDALSGKPWHNSFLNPEDSSSTILDDSAQELSELSLWKDEDGEIHTETFMDFDGVDGFTELPPELYDMCLERFDDEDDFYDKDVIDDMSVNELLKRAKYYDYKGEKAVYFWSDDSEGGHLVIFGEKAFRKMLEAILS